MTQFFNSRRKFYFVLKKLVNSRIKDAHRLAKRFQLRSLVSLRVFRKKNPSNHTVVMARLKSIWPQKLNISSQKKTFDDNISILLVLFFIFNIYFTCFSKKLACLSYIKFEDK